MFYNLFYMKAIEKECNDLKGYSLCFEGNKHLATIIELPYREDTWKEEAKPALEEFLLVAQSIAKYEKVIVVIDPKIPYDVVEKFQFTNTFILRENYNDSWARDNTPIFMKNKEDNLVGLDFKFNSWGGEYNGLYSDYEFDDALSRNILLDLRIPRHGKKDFVLEGGNILYDGHGTLFTSKECQVSKGRNPLMNIKKIEEYLKEAFNVENIVFVPYGLYADETSGHIDNIISLLDENTIALSFYKEDDDPQYLRSKEDYIFLKNIVDVNNKKYNIILLPCPRPLYMSKEDENSLITLDGINRKEGRRLAASYCNLYQGEKFVLVPQFSTQEDEEALAILKNFYSGKKEVIPIKSRNILLGGGNIHCITKEIPFSPKYEIDKEVL